MSTMSCRICGRVPREIEPYIDATIVGRVESPEEFVRDLEATFDERTGRFVCPGCLALAVSALQVFETLHCHCAKCER